MKQIRTQNKHIASIFISPPRNKYTCQKRIYASSSRARAYDVEEEDEYVNDEDGYDIEEDDNVDGEFDDDDDFGDFDEQVNKELYQFYDFIQ